MLQSSSRRDQLSITTMFITSCLQEQLRNPNLHNIHNNIIPICTGLLCSECAVCVGQICAVINMHHGFSFIKVPCNHFHVDESCWKQLAMGSSLILVDRWSLSTLRFSRQQNVKIGAPPTTLATKAYEEGEGLR